MSAVEAPAHAAVPRRQMGSVNLGGWLTSVDHARIGRVTVVGSGVWLLATAVLWMLSAVERIDPTSFVLTVDAYPQVFAFVRTSAILGVAAPLGLGLAVAAVPRLVGAPTVAFARLAYFGVAAWLGGGVMTMVGIAGNGGPGGGEARMVDLYLLGLGLALVGLISVAVSVASTVLAFRRPGLALADVPMLAWSSLVGSLAVLLTFPVILGTTIYVAIDHRYERLAFGGADGVWTHLGWGFTQPQSFVSAIVAVGVLAHVAPLAARVRQPLRPVMLVGIGIVATTIVGSVTQTPRTLQLEGGLTDVATSLVPWALYNVFPILGVLVVVALSLLALATGTPRLLAPFVPAFLGVGMVLTGMLGHAVSGIDAAGLAGTVFEEGALLYVAYGSALAVWGGMAIVAPSWSGRTIPNAVVLGVAMLGFLGTVLAALPLYVAGFADQPAERAGEFDYSGPIGLWNGLSAAGHGLVLLAVLGALLSGTRALAKGAVGPDDPWGES